MQTTLITLPYAPDSSGLFTKLIDLPWAVFLDSGHPFATSGRYDILSACPYTTLVTHDEYTEITTAQGKTSHQDDPFILLRKELKKFNIINDTQLPFIGGAIAYYSYDLARRIEKFPLHAKKDIHIPEMAVGLYDWAIVVDHQAQQSYWVSANTQKETPQLRQMILERLRHPMIENIDEFELTEPIHFNMTKAQYKKAFDRIKQYIYDGDCYQANLSQRAQATYAGSPWILYQALRQKNPATFSAYMNIPNGHILSLSPERFLRVQDGLVETKPIKGTRPRGKDQYDDKKLQEELSNSIKDRAENLMIVDLMRNDLGKICEIGSVKVPALFTIETLPAVHHLVSTVTGRLSPDTSHIDLLRACFPGGSVTGAPKIRAMEIIEELEPQRRSIYCGSIGYAGFDGNMDCNIAIRTLVCHNNTLYCSAGGALVADSELDAEYQETFDKINIILEVVREQII